MDNNNLSNITANTFNFYYNSLDEDDIIKILNKINNIEDISMDIHKLNKILYKLDLDVFKKILKNLTVKDLSYIFKNCMDDDYLFNNFNFWQNKNCFEDLNETIKILNYNKLLYLLDKMDDVIFKMNIHKLKLYQIKLIYPYIKDNNVKLKIFINSIDEEYLIFLINELDDETIKFLNLNYNFIFRFNQISIFSTVNMEEINEMNVTKLQIILLLGTSNESKIKKKILDFEFDFIKKIINFVNTTTFTYIIMNIQINMIYELIDILNDCHLITLIDNINFDLLHIMCVKLTLEKLCKLISHFSLNQFINSLYYITDDKIECLKYMNSNHKNYINNLFSLINPNLYNEYLNNFTKQIIFCLLQTDSKNIILSNSIHINLNTIKLIINYLNYHDIIKILNQYNIKNRLEIITSIKEHNYHMISNFVDGIMYNSVIDDLSMDNKINFVLFYKFINLNLSPESNIKINKILDIINV